MKVFFVLVCLMFVLSACVVNVVPPTLTAAPTPTVTVVSPISTAVAVSTPTQIPTQLPTLVPVPTQVFFTVNGIRGEAFSLSKFVYKVNEQIWFHFRVRNTLDVDVRYSGLGVVINDHKSQPSWGDQILKARSVLEWDDHIEYGVAGKYKIYLGLCWAANWGECAKTIDRNGWEWLSAPLELELIP